MIPVYIASKGRPDCKTAKLIDSAIVVIEPQDLPHYNHLPNKLLVMPENNKGLVYVRNYICDHAKRRGHEFFWILDDDFRKFLKQQNKRAVECKWSEAKEDTEAMMQKYPHVIGLMALESRQYIWSTTKKFSENNVCDCAVLVNAAVLEKCRYDSNFKLKVDRDFTLQVKKAGYRVIKQRNKGYDCPDNGSNKGGLYDTYKSNIEEAMSKQLCEKWPNIVEMNYKKDGRPDAKINWSKM